MNRFVDHNMLMRYYWGLGVGHLYSHVPDKANKVKPAEFDDLNNGHTMSELDALEWQLLSEFSSYDFADTSSSLAHGFEDPDSSLFPADLESLE